MTPDSRWVATLVLGLFLLVGAVAGVAADRWILLPNRMLTGLRPPRGLMRASLAEREAAFRARRAELNKEIGTTLAQDAAIEAIIVRQSVGVHQLRERVRPRMDSIFASGQRSIDSVLTPEQRTKLAALRRRHEAEVRGGPPLPGWDLPPAAAREWAPATSDRR